MAGSESDEEAYLTDDATSHVASAVNKCLSMKPEYSKKVKSKAKNSTVLRAQLDKFKLVQVRKESLTGWTAVNSSMTISVSLQPILLL